MNAIILMSLFLGALTVTMSHAHAIHGALARASAPREERLRLWRRHERRNGILWVLLFIAIVISEFFFSHEQIVPHLYIGIWLIVSGLALVVWSRFILGRSGAMGIRWFLPEDSPPWEKRGPYQILANPMYDGFILIFLGLGIGFGIRENFYLALASFLLLNLYLAKVESRGHSYHVI